jgi:hypothetical protein
LEADDARSLRRPYGEVTVHAAADEPDFLPLVAAWEGILAGLADTARPVWTDTVRNARQLEIDASGRTGKAERLRFVIECSAFLAKRRRRAVVALVDKTHHLLHVMDFSRAQSGR